ncbi:hypothetical protein GCM10020358_17480 [Amorphoplanes nipponensis]|uniref:Uncharacterized protein n=1 Tax=Actinoplanes nipponensis TaxID=135950 RepID=A0A919JK47_9ACTN|nr:hypothetical protein [Actinoplanes nipponensis]GIE50656.1 hypothetical protein Ani05nite_41900 [Actinoplanes nipponensis]
MDLLRVGQWVFVLLLPTLAIGAAIYLPRAARALWRTLRPDPPSTPTSPPIEQLAATLHRLLRQHHALRHSPDVALRARRLHGVEAAISDCALAAAAALGVQAPAAAGPTGLRPAALSRLLRDLAAAGLVLPRGVDLVDGDRGV